MAISNRRKRTLEYLTKEELDKLLAASREPGNSRNPARDYLHAAPDVPAWIESQRTLRVETL